MYSLFIIYFPKCISNHTSLCRLSHIWLNIIIGLYFKILKFLFYFIKIGLIRGGHVDACFLGALEVDAEGNLANWIIPGKKAPGMGGAMDLLTGADKVILAMEHTAKGAPKILKKCTLPLTAKGSVNMIVTEMGVMEITPEGIVLTEINPEFTVEQVQAATEAHLIVSKDLKPMKK